MSGGKRKILFIDDEENILSSLRRVFRKEAMETYFTTDPEEAFRLVTEEEIAVIVSDQRMPTMEGVEVLKKVQALSPHTVRMMLTGYADIKSAMRAVNDGNVFRFMAKPWQEEELRNAVEAGIAQYSLLEENRRLVALTNRQNQELMQFNEDLEKRVDERTAEVKKLNGELKSAFFSTIKIMGSIGGILDPSQDGHSRRVAKIAGYIAKSLEMTERETFEVQVAAFVHNLGGLGPKRTARDPQHQQEFEAKLSAKIVSLIPNIGKAPLYVLHQLERCDGQGYPDHLTTTAIPLGARIIAVASTYDRLLHLGGMKLASPLNALEEIKGKAGSAFDPRVIKCLDHYVNDYLKEAEREFEQSLGLVELQVGMIVSRPVLTKRGEVLVAKDFELNDEVLEGLWQRQLNERPIGEIYVYRTSLPSVSKTA